MEMTGIKQNNKVKKVLKVSFFTNFFLAIFKIICGYLFFSKALIADGVHSFSDLLTDFISFFGSFLSNKPADKEHPYGHGKYEYLTSMLIGLIVLSLGAGIIYNSFSNEVVIPSILVILISLITIISKLLLSRFLTKKGIEYKNNILIANGKESKMDVISSLVVLISSILMQLTSKFSFLKYADKAATFIGGILIIKVGLEIFIENMNTILGEQESDLEVIEAIKSKMLKHDIMTIDDIVLLKFGSYYKLTCEVGMDENLSLLEAHNIVEAIEADLKESGNIKYINIHMNPKNKDKKSCQEKKSDV